MIVRPCCRGACQMLRICTSMSKYKKKKTESSQNTTADLNVSTLKYKSAVFWEPARGQGSHPLRRAPPSRGGSSRGEGVKFEGSPLRLG